MPPGDTPKPEVQAVLTDVDALKTAKKGDHIDGTKLYNDLKALYTADGGAATVTNASDFTKNPKYIADIKVINQHMADNNILPGFSLFAANQDVVAFVDGSNKTFVAPKADVTNMHAVPGQGQGTDQGRGQGTDQGRGQGTDQGRGQGTDQGRGQGTDQGATPKPGDPQTFGPNGRQYQKVDDGQGHVGYKYQLRQQAKGNDTIWWAAKDYLRAAHPDRTGDNDIKDSEVAAKVKAIYDANKKDGQSYADFLDAAKKMGTTDSFIIPVDPATEKPPGGTPANTDTLTHSDQAKTDVPNADGSTTRLDANGKAVEVKYDDTHNAVAHRDASGNVDKLTDLNGNVYSKDAQNKWTETDNTGAKVADPPSGPITNVDMDTKGNVIITRGQANETTSTDATTVKTDANGKASEIDYPDGNQATVQRGQDGNVNKYTDSAGNVYTQDATTKKWSAVDSSNKPIADPPSGPVSSIDMGPDGTVTIKRNGQAKDVTDRTDATRSYPDYDGTPAAGQDGSTVKTKAFNGKNQVVEVDYPNNGGSATFQRNADGSLNSYTDASGVTYTKGSDNTWQPNGKPEDPANPNGAINDISVADDGTVTLKRTGQAKDVVHTNHSAESFDGNNKLTAKALPNGVNLALDANGRVTDVAPASGALITHFDYTDQGAIKSVKKTAMGADNKPVTNEIISFDGTNYSAVSGGQKIPLKGAPTVDVNTGNCTIITADGTTYILQPDGSTVKQTPTPTQ